MTDLSDPLARIGDEAAQQLVRRCLVDERAELLDYENHEITLGGGSGTRLHRVRGRAAIAGQDPAEWAVVLKFFTPELYDFQTISNDPGAFDYWKREWCLYQSDWIGELPGPLVPARCHGAGEFDDDGHPVAWLALEDLGRQDRRWSVPTFRQVARNAGRFNAWSLTRPDPPRDDWLAADWLGGAVEHAGSVVDQLDAARADPILGRVITADFVRDVQRLWAARATVVAALAELPQPMCHSDLFTRNVFPRTEHSVAIDWAYCGPGALGQELTAMFGSSAVFLDSAPGEWQLIEDELLAGYADGLRDGGWSATDDDLKRGYGLSLSLRFGLSTMPALAGMTLYPDLHAQVAKVLDCEYEDFVVNSAAFCEFVHHHIRETLALVGA